jgi:hypothetical protein
MKRDFELVWKEIEEYFNFENVYKVMKALDWHWYMGETESEVEMQGVPTVKYIKARAKELCKQSYLDGCCRSTGGFSCGIENDELYLAFTLEENSALINE